MDKSVWLDILKVIAGILTGGGLWAWVKAREDKRKTPYDMLKDLLEEHKRFYVEKNAEYEMEKLDSAEKSAVIMESHACQHRFKDPSIMCPVDIANKERLKKRCERCNYSGIKIDE